MIQKNEISLWWSKKELLLFTVHYFCAEVWSQLSMFNLQISPLCLTNHNQIKVWMQTSEFYFIFCDFCMYGYKMFLRKNILYPKTIDCRHCYVMLSLYYRQVAKMWNFFFLNGGKTNKLKENQWEKLRCDTNKGSAWFDPKSDPLKPRRQSAHVPNNV